MAVVHEGATPEQALARLRVSVARIGIVGGGLMGRELAAAIGRWAALEDHPVTAAARGGLRHERRGARVVRAHRRPCACCTDDRRRAARGPRPRRPLPRRPAPPARGALPRGDRGRQGLPGREAVRHRPRRRRAGSSTRSTRSGRVRPLLERDALLPRRPARLRDDPLRRARRADRGRARASCTPATSTAPSRSTGSARPRFCGETGVMNDLGMHVAAPAAAARLAAAAASTRCCRTSSASAPAPTASPSAATPGTTRRCTPTPASRSRSRRSGSRRARRTRGGCGRSGWTAASSSPPPARRRSTASRSATAARCGSGSRPAASRRSRPCTGPIFEFGFSDAILQMWAAFLAEREGALGDRLGCVTPARGAGGARDLRTRRWNPARRAAVEPVPIA